MHKDLGHRIEEVEQTVEDTETKLSHHDVILQEHTTQIQQLFFYGLDDQENRSCRNNIRICSLPETVEPKDLTWRSQLFSINYYNSPIKIDRINRLWARAASTQHFRKM